MGVFGYELLTSSLAPAGQPKRAAEVADSRLATVADVDMLVEDGSADTCRGDWALHMGSPVRASEEELGARS